MIWQENFIQMYLCSARRNSLPLHLWVTAYTIAKSQNVRVCMHAGGMCMVCCYNPEGLGLPVT